MKRNWWQRNANELKTALIITVFGAGLSYNIWLNQRTMDNSESTKQDVIQLREQFSGYKENYNKLCSDNDDEHDYFNKQLLTLNNRVLVLEIKKENKNIK
jgi:hypothetical protein